MKNLKKVLALVMAFAMAFTMMASAAFTDQADITAVEAVNMLTALGVVNGNPDGSFKPNGTVTRAEMATMIYIVRNGGNKDASSFAGMKTTFKDVDSHWAAGYIKYCQSVGIISGKSATVFDPNAPVTGVEAALMCLRVMGYDPAKSDIGGSTWSQTTIGLASENGLLEGVNTGMDAAAPRQYAAQMIYNTLNADVVKWSNDKEDYVNESETKTTTELAPIYDKDGKVTGYNTVSKTATTNIDVAQKYMNLISAKGVLNAAGKLSINGAKAADDYVTVGASDYKVDNKDFTALLGQKVKLMYKVVNGKTNVYGVYALPDDNNVTIGSTAKLKDVEKTSMKLDGKTVKFDTTPSIYAKNYTGENDNYVTLTINELKNLFTEKHNFTVSAIDNDDNGKVDVVLVDVKAVGQVRSATSSAFTVSVFDIDGTEGTIFGTDVKYDGSTSIKYDYKDVDITNPTVYSGMAREDYVVLSKDAITGAPIVEKATVVTGKISSIQGSSLKIDGNWYKTVAKETVKAGDEASFYLYNDVVYYVGDIDSTADVKDYVLVTGVGDSFGTTQIRILKADGTTTVVEPYTEAPAASEKYKWETDLQADDANQLYRIEAKSGKYKFFKATAEIATKKDDFDGFAAVTAKDAFKYDTTNSKTTLAGSRIADDAVIYAKVDGTYKVISGKDLKSMDITKTSAKWTVSANGAAITKDASSGLPNVQVAFIGELGKAVSGAGSTKYAYVVDAMGTATDASGDIVATITIAKGTEKEVLTGDDNTGSVVKGNLIKYELNSDGTVDMSSIVVLKTAALASDDKGETVSPVAITGVDGKDIVVNGNKILTSDSDTVIVYINGKDGKGAEEFSLMTADKDVNSKYINNAYVSYEVDSKDGNLITVLIVDSDNDITNNGEKVVFDD